MNNVAASVNNGITLISSVLNIDNATVLYTNPAYINQLSYTVDTGFFNLNYRSSLSVTRSLFRNCRGAIAGLLYATGSSTVSLLDGTFIIDSYS